MQCSLFNKSHWDSNILFDHQINGLIWVLLRVPIFVLPSAKQELERQVNRLLGRWIILPESPISGWLTYLLAPQRMC